MSDLLPLTTTIPILIILFGLIFGSFLTVCIYRLPFASLADEGSSEEQDRVEQSDGGVASPFDTIDTPLPETPHQHLSISDPPRSFCTACFQQLRWWHNVPVFSWLFLRGRCSYCKHPIPARYPLIELTTVFFALLSYAIFGLSLTALVIFAVTCALIVITVIDYDYFIIPDLISLPGTALGFGFAAINHVFEIFDPPLVSTIGESLLGMFSGAGFLFIVSEFYLRVRKIEGLGLGDVKLLAMVGAFFGAECSLYTIFIGSLLGAVIGLLLILFRGKKMSQPLPFGPYLAVATLIYVFGGSDIVIATADTIGRLVRFSW